mmetsp:Transcript_32297/g.55866  ORF Transcript_32297/g.55866 Transcript_32297/m.55866 type:complete len:106 (-) Transcript_32297:1551-1868(-)
MLHSISSLVKNPWPEQGCARHSTPQHDVLAVIAGPSETRVVRNADPVKGLLEVVVVSTDIEEDTSLLESLLSDCLSSVIDLTAYPNLSLTLTVVIFSASGLVAFT